MLGLFVGAYRTVKWSLLPDKERCFFEREKGPWLPGNANGRACGSLCFSAFRGQG